MVTRRLVLFDLDNTLVDRLDAFRRWTREFVARRELGEGAFEWMVRLDEDGAVPREVFFRRGKPDVRLFEIAAERCGTTLGHGGGWVVGDDAVEVIMAEGGGGR
ncbi:MULTISPECIES: hypothetical protein [unclassified Nonomuraea]|uniref:hypothetical protein n=1 Tax=unclassified Nonomuraea TaxID=2593643 RepID=UPI0033E36C12